MIYIIVGSSCAGKTSFVLNSFTNNNMILKKDLIKYTECDNNILLGDYTVQKRAKGTDTISRADLGKIAEQIDKFLTDFPDKNIILEGEKIISRNLFNHILELNQDVKMYHIYCDKEVSILRNKRNNSSVNEKTLKAAHTKTENIFNEYRNVFDGEVINTNNIEDFSKLKIEQKTHKKASSKIRDDFAVFILSHGRANNVKTLTTLKKCGYIGKTYIICDNEDEQIEDYKKLDCTDVIVFNKEQEMKRTDTIDNFKKKKAVVYARNVCHDIAKTLNLTYFLVLDDDYTEFRFRIEENGILTSVYCRHFNELCEAMINFLEKSGALTVAFAQTGDFIGGTGSKVFKEQLSRKAMNSFFCKVDREFKFLGSINEDVNAYVTLGNQGKLFFTVAQATLNQTDTQQNEGGLTDIYLDLGTYIKSFYSVICSPSCVKITTMGVNSRRIHHKISWNNCCPKILSEKHKRKE